ncbi:hypothetical protein [Salisediminibacterium beveridgei]|uniref:Uncharacterized protein n=1 Tax=Salisediminibacterium beveridgei TaxID=632773 RepID=A0A1D7QXG8_9BACI|nr:hypothetical protein [Salisediminibacterium beveridgei]AOM83707.1 hypothetical protein BBEV_2366 [Salisediminibacterium beveridgei]
MNVSKKDVLRMVEHMSETELRIVYTFMEEFRIAEAERSASIQHDPGDGSAHQRSN